MSERRPRVSVVIEGYNESRDLGSADAVLRGLLQQRGIALGDVEVILVGSAGQVAAWRALGEGTPFFRVLTVAADGAHYYALKNEGVRHATADVLAFLDSDAEPEPGWLAALVASVEAGADVSAGVTLFRGEDGRPSSDPLLQVAAAISWGFVVPHPGASAVPAGFLSHNVGFRAATFRRHAYRTDLGRTCAGSVLFADLRAAGARMRFEPGQRVAHVFALGWWVLRLHRRFGYEVLQLRRLDETRRHGWLDALGWLAAPLTVLWHAALDVPQWLRFARVAGLSRRRRALLLPLVVPMSCLARGGELVGMVQTLASPEAMKRFAESN